MSVRKWRILIKQPGRQVFSSWMRLDLIQVLTICQQWELFMRLKKREAKLKVFARTAVAFPRYQVIICLSDINFHGAHERFWWLVKITDNTLKMGSQYLLQAKIFSKIIILSILKVWVVWRPTRIAMHFLIKIYMD